MMPTLQYTARPSEPRLKRTCAVVDQASVNSPQRLPVQAGPVPDRLTVWPVDDGRYGLDAAFQGPPAISVQSTRSRSSFVVKSAQLPARAGRRLDPALRPTKRR